MAAFILPRKYGESGLLAAQASGEDLARTLLW